MASIQIRVAPAVMRNQAEGIRKTVSKIRGNYEGLKRVAETTSAHWLGDAAQSYRSRVESLDQEMQKVLKRLSEHPVDLLKMADLYDEGEEKAVDAASSLPTDVIS